MGKWKAISSRRVDEQFLRALLSSEDTSWESVAHVTATASLARSIRKTGTVGMPIATLSDLIIQPGLVDMPISLDEFPGPEFLAHGKKPYDNAVTAWQQQVTGRRFRLSIKFDDELRRYARTVLQASDLGKLLVRSRREFSRTVHTLVAAGVSPAELAVSSDLGRAAVTAWEWLEGEIPALAAPRRDLWTDLNDFREQTSAHATGLSERITLALTRAFGTTTGRRVIVHHGFYFFTPPQWALFQLLRQMPNVDQIFIVHDDGSNPAFETWRRFFVEKLGMPRPTQSDTALGGLTEDTFRATALLKALRGERVPDEDLASELSVVECRNPSELVRLWHGEPSGAEGPARRFAADAKSVERFVRRLRRDGDSESVDLAQLPIGSFLLAVHDCIKPLSDGGVEIVLSDNAVLEIAASGFLEVVGSAGTTQAYVGAIRRALPFFRGCRTGEQWRNRAEQLHRLILSDVSPLGARLPSVSDLERIRLAVENPLRLAPWADVSVDEALGIQLVIETTVKLVEQMASQERIALKTHIQFLQRKLAHGMQGLPEEDRQLIEAKVRGFSVGLEEEIDVIGLVDIVAMLLGRTAEFDSSGDEDLSDGKVRDLRGLDSLGMHRLNDSIHITNLADGKFPNVVRAVGWPFGLDDMTAPDSSVNQRIVDILRVRSENASLSDLYLLWLAMDGVVDNHKISMSWISELGGEKLSLSPMVLLLTSLDRGKPAVKARAGGVKISPVKLASGLRPVNEFPMPRLLALPDAVLESVAGQIDPRAAASAIACPRRFALQWVLGQSHAFQSDHHQSILYGNMTGALVRLKKMNVGDAMRAANDLWRHLTPGQRRSSAAKSRLRAFGNGSPDGVWVLTLGGSKTKSKNIDLTYQAAITRKRPSLETIAPEEAGYLPPGIRSAEVCGQCPVRPSCIASE